MFNVMTVCGYVHRIKCITPHTKHDNHHQGVMKA